MMELAFPELPIAELLFSKLQIAELLKVEEFSEFPLEMAMMLALIYGVHMP